MQRLSLPKITTAVVAWCCLLLLVSSISVTPALGANVIPESTHMLFRLVDTDGDGVWTAGELNEHFAQGKAVPAHLDAVISMWDNDHDEILTVLDLHHRISASGSANAIEQVHLALTGDNTEMSVDFVILSSTVESSAVVTVRPVGGVAADVSSFTCIPSTYSVPSRWWEPFGWVGTIYRTKITGLLPGRPYEYNITTTQHSRTGFTFTSAPELQDGKESKMALYGDMGTYVPLGFKVTEKIIEEHKKDPYDLNFLFGDVSYAGIDANIPFVNFTKADEWQFVWDLFGRQIEPLASISPYMVGVGNHDMFYNSSAFSARFQMPSHTSRGQGNFWYSFDYNNIHIVSASSEHDFSTGSEQIKWIEADLIKANANRSKVPWVFFFIHKPIYSADSSGYDAHSPGGARQVAFEPLLLKYNVDLVFCGHQHTFERVHPVNNGTVVSYGEVVNGELVYRNPKAPPHMVVGSSGAMQFDFFVPSPPAWSAVRASMGAWHTPEASVQGNFTDTFGYSQLQAFNRTHLRVAFMPITGAFSDVFWIVRD